MCFFFPSFLLFVNKKPKKVTMTTTFEQRSTGILALDDKDCTGSGLYVDEEKKQAVNSELISNYQLLKTDNDDDKLIHLVNLGELYFLNKQYQQCYDILSKAQYTFSSASNELIKSLNFKKCYYLVASSDKIGSQQTNIATTLSETMNCFKELPKSSNLESNKWISLVFSQISTKFGGNFTKIEEIFDDNKNYLLYYIINIKRTTSIKLKDEDVSKIIKSQENKLGKVKFPKSNEINNVEIEDFYQCLVDLNYKQNYFDFVVSRTYQSQSVLVNYLKYSINFKEIELIKPCFETLFQYFKNNGEVDPIKTLDLYYYFFEKIDINLFNNIEFIKLIFIKFLTAVQKFNISTGKYTKELKKKLSSYYSCLGDVNCKIYKQSKLFSKDLLNFKKSLDYYENSIKLDDNPKVVLKLSKLLSKLGNITESLKLVKNLLSNYHERDEIYFKSWHLLVLILSIEENKDESFKIASFLVNEVNENKFKFANSKNLNILIEIKITQLFLIEEIYGIERSLENVSELFDLYNKLSLDDDLILQKIWIILTNFYIKNGNINEASNSLAEAEKLSKSNNIDIDIFKIKIYTLSTASNAKETSLTEFEKLLLSNSDNKQSSFLIYEACEFYLNNFINDDKLILKSKILLENFINSYDGYFNLKTWWNLSIIYEKIKDFKNFKQSLWKCIELEETKSIRDVDILY